MKARLLMAAAVSLAMAAVASPARADGSMMIFPINPYFTDAIHTQHINVVNNSETAATFRVVLTYERQNPDGTPVHLETSPDPNFDPAKIVIYSPRQVFLQPGDVQTVKLALRRTADMPEGESRVYLKLMRMDDNGPRIGVDGNGNAIASSSGSGRGGLHAQIGIQIGYAIPVIIRHGKSDTTAKIEDFKIQPPSADGKKPESIAFTVKRSGKFGTIGKVSVFWTAPGQAEKLVSKANINVFPENNIRTVSIPLTERVSGGTMRVVYDGRDDGPDKDVTFDEKTFPVAG